MTDEMIALARRAVACPKWKWMPGMKLTAGLRLSESLIPFTFSVDLPDLTDPATLGCLLALVREAFARPNGHLSFLGHSGSSPRGWFYCWATSDGSNGGGLHRYSPTEAEALVAALEAATDGR